MSQSQSNTMTTMFYQPKGFSLIEVMVVLFIVSIMSGIGIANLPRFAQTGDFDLESRRLKVLLEMAREESVMQALEFGFTPSRTGYAFSVFNEVEQKWAKYELAPFASRQLPESMKLELDVEDTDFSLSTESEAKVPPVLLLSSGETTPFTLTISQGQGLRKSLESDGYSDIDWLDDE
jgi:general secretion pathway protein H